MDEMKLEVGKYYRTRDGRKVGPLAIAKDSGLDGHFWIDEFGLFTADGLFGYIEQGAHLCPAYSLDLISEWTDTPTIGTLAEIGAKVGDVVACYNGTHNGTEFPVDSGFEAWCAADEQWWRIVSRASYANHLEADICQSCKGPYSYHHDCKCGKCERGPVITETVKRIVPGVYGRVSIHKNTYNDGKVLIRLADGAGEVNLNNCGHYMSRAELIAARDVFNQLIDAMPHE